MQTARLVFIVIIALSYIYGCGEEEQSPSEIVSETSRITPQDGGTPGDEMALIPAGDFQMGSNDGESDEEPVHKVYVSQFYMDKNEVTNAQYAKFLNEYSKNTDKAGHFLLDIDDSDCLIEKTENTYRSKAGYENHPVVEVSWYGAAAYAQFYGKRLPTEAEWEKAARGGMDGKKYPWGDNITHSNANYAGTGSKDEWPKASPVGSFEPSGYGLYDMAGNAWEWCADEYNSLYYGKSPGDMPAGPGVAIKFKDDDFAEVSVNSARIVRGGSWGDNSFGLRVANRGKFDVYDSSLDIGFRCVK